MKNKFSGKFIVIDGPDGCGKSIQTKLLSQWIETQGCKTATFRDPGTTIIGEKIRHILLDTAHTEMDVRTEIMLYMAARAQLWHECISPALKENTCVILDRWLSSTCAYQGYAGGFGVQKIIKIAEDALDRPWPDLTIILDLDLKTANTRLKPQLDRMEQKGSSYHNNVRHGFLELAKIRKDVVVIDAAQDIQTVHKKIIEVISK